MKNNTNNNILLQIKIIITFALINSSYFIAIGDNGTIRFICILLMNLSGLLIILNYLKYQKKLRSMKVNYYFRTIIFFLILWSLYTFFRSFSLDIKSLISLFGHPIMGWTWLAPFSLICGLNMLIWKNLSKYFSNILLVGIFLGLIGIFSTEKVARGILEFFVFLPILLFTLKYQRKKIKRITVFSVVIFIALSFVVSQRVNSIYLFLIIVFAYNEHIRYSKRKNFIKLFWLICSLLIVNFIFTTFNEKNSTLKDSELFKDNRSFLFTEMFTDMKANELIIGRGALGKYYSDYFYYASRTRGVQSDNENRSSIEVGYLQLILKGGYIMFFLYILILLPVAFLGIFKSKNTICKMCGYYILIYVICWSVSYYPIFSAEYILLWISVGTILPKKNRLQLNRELFNKINK